MSVGKFQLTWNKANPPKTEKQQQKRTIHFFLEPPFHLKYFPFNTRKAAPKNERTSQKKKKTVYFILFLQLNRFVLFCLDRGA